MKSIKTTYFLAICCTLIPAWMGNIFFTNSSDFENLFQFNLISGIILYTIAIAGTSVAFYYLQLKKYAILSLLGKILLVISGVLIYKLTGSIGHPYLVFLGIMGAMTWGLIDFILLYPTAKKINLAHK